MLSNHVIFTKDLNQPRQDYDYDANYYDEDYPNNNDQCIVNQCSQSVTGRRLSYARALEIIQDEEYLDETDFDIIRKHHRQKRPAPATTTTTTTTTTPAPSIFDNLLDSLPSPGAAAGAAGAAAAASVAMNPALPMTTGGVPPGRSRSVSYTHLTLPTIYSV